jgi:N-carbamoylsarcosine amidase
MKSTLQKAVLCVAAVLVLGLVFGTQAAAADKPFYKGKTLKLIVDYSAGGPTDLECRVYARHLKKHLAGNPSIVIQNRAGGGGNLAMNWIYERARRNGTVMGCQTASGRYQEWFVGDPKKAGLRANMEEIIPANQALLAAAREKRIPVVFTSTAYRNPAGPHPDTGLWHLKIPTEILSEGSEATAIDDRLDPEPGEQVVLKKRASAFHGTWLAGYLRAQRVDTVIITGVTMAGCVRHSVEDAIADGFRPIVVREAVGDRVPGAVEWNLFDIDAKFGDVEPLENVLSYLSNLPALAND